VHFQYDFNMTSERDRSEVAQFLADYDTGALERRVPMGQVMVPMSVMIVDRALVFAEYPLTKAKARQILDRGDAATYDDLRQGRKRAPKGIRWANPRRGMLERFARLATATDDDVLKYALRWGGLMVCHHRLPSSHNPSPIPYPNPVPRPIPWCHPLGWGGHSWWEPIEVWQELAGRALAMLEIAAALRRGQLGAKQAWARVMDGPEAFRGNPGSDLASDANLLSLQVHQWLRMGQVCPHIYSFRGRFLVRMGGWHTFRVLAYQLMLAVAGGQAIAVCSGCGDHFKPRRLPATGRRSYCSNCRRRGIPLRDAQRAHRARMRE